MNDSTSGQVIAQIVLPEHVVPLEMRVADL
jgi:hypothetical protein